MVEDLGATQLEWALTLNEDLSYAITIDVQSLSQFFSSSKVAVDIPQGRKSLVTNTVYRANTLLKMGRYYNTTMRHYWDMLVK